MVNEYVDLANKFLFADFSIKAYSTSSVFRAQLEVDNRPKREIIHIKNVVNSYKPVAAHSNNVSDNIFGSILC